MTQLPGIRTVTATNLETHFPIIGQIDHSHDPKISPIRAEDLWIANLYLPLEQADEIEALFALNRNYEGRQLILEGLAVQAVRLRETNSPEYFPVIKAYLVVAY